ncbi:unnamed protein product, partial [marine sediment metagenome]
PHSLEAEVRLYDYLLLDEGPEGEDEGADFTARLNPESVVTLASCPVEPSLAGAAPGSRYQFERQGYFCVDPDSTDGKLVLNRTVTLRDKWARIQKAEKRRRSRD